MAQAADSLADDFNALEELVDWARENQVIIQLVGHQLRIWGPPGLAVENINPIAADDSFCDALMTRLAEVKAEAAIMLRNNQENAELKRRQREQRKRCR